MGSSSLPDGVRVVFSGTISKKSSKTILCEDVLFGFFVFCRKLFKVG